MSWSVVGVRLESRTYVCADLPAHRHMSVSNSGIFADSVHNPKRRCVSLLSTIKLQHRNVVEPRPEQSI
jgi:hypothetical protein